MAEKFDIVTRYGRGPGPDVETMCKGQCEGLGWVPVHESSQNDDEGNWHDLWLASSQIPEDGYKFVQCPRCKGSGKEPTQ